MKAGVPASSLSPVVSSASPNELSQANPVIDPRRSFLQPDGALYG